MLTKPLVFLELNEISFDYVKAYMARGELPHFASLIREYGYTETTSEKQYRDLEPWIQWVTVHTGLTFGEHGVFRLGDFVDTRFPQIWELLEEGGLTVGALSPMNAANRLKHPAFFVPDPWTATSTAGGKLLSELAQAVAQTVNDNSEARISQRSAWVLLLCAARYAYPSMYAAYLADALKSRGRPWRKAMVLDRLLANVFEREWRKRRPDFASLFLNGGAFAQHHYMFSSPTYEGAQRNPEWYARPGEDPMLELYRLYDDILGRFARHRESRLMVATALHQVPYRQVTYYWRLRDHAATLKKWGVSFGSVHPRMSRDFLVTCNSTDEANSAADMLEAATDRDGIPLFEVDRRGSDLFVMLIYANDIDKSFLVKIGSRTYDDLAADVVFVAIKNGHHSGIGYFLDTGEHASERPPSIPLAQLKDKIMLACGVPSSTTPELAVA